MLTAFAVGVPKVGLTDKFMATVPKLAPAPAPASASTARSGPPSRVASLGSSIDELQGSNSVAFNSGAFGFREEASSSFDQGGGRQGSPHQPGVVNAPTQAFAALLESGGQDSQGREIDVKSPQYAGIVSRAISIYEANANILAGTNNVLGTSISIVL